MFKKIKTIIGNAGNLLKKLPNIAAIYAFLTYLVLLLPILAFGGFLFYQYKALEQQAALETINPKIQLKTTAYEKILEEWDRREKLFQETKIIDYQNPFRGTTSEPII